MTVTCAGSLIGSANVVDWMSFSMANAAYDQGGHTTSLPVLMWGHTSNTKQKTRKNILGYKKKLTRTPQILFIGRYSSKVTLQVIHPLVQLFRNQIGY